MSGSGRVITPQQRIDLKQVLQDFGVPTELEHHADQAGTSGRGAADPSQESAVAAGLQLAAAVLEPIRKQLTTAVGQLRQLLPESHAASSIADDDLQEFRRKANVVLVEVHSDTKWDDLTSKSLEPAPDGFRWEPGVSEPQQADRYVPFWKERIGDAAFRLQMPLPAGLTMDDWCRCDHMAPIRFRHNMCPFSLSSKNDLVLMGSFYESSVIGVELKTDNDFNEQALRQGEVELYTWDSSVTYPFLQLVTDLCRGGVAYWCSESPLQVSAPIIVKRQVLGTMREVYEFVARAVHNLPDDMVQRRPDVHLHEPHRVKIFKPRLGLAVVHEEPEEEEATFSGGGPSGGGGPFDSTPDGSGGRDASQHSPKQEKRPKMPRLGGQTGGTSTRNERMLCYLQALLANADDVANMRDLDGFD